MISRDEYLEFQKDFLERFAEARREIHKRVVGLEDLIRVFFGCVLGRGHCAVQASPGMGKTTAIMTMAGILDANFVRIPFVPTMQPQDLGLQPIPIEGGMGMTSRWTIKEGPLFRADIFFGNEFNRAPEKVQSALLSALEEYEYQYLGEMKKLRPFFTAVIDYNTLESAVTYGFSEAAFDRFMATVDIRDYDSQTLREIIATSERKKMEPDVVNLKKIFTTEELLVSAAKLYQYFKWYDDPSSWLVRYLEAVLSAVRSDDDVSRDPRNKQAVGPSPRGAEDAKALSRVFAFLDGEDLIWPEHAKEAIRYAFAGKFFVKPKAMNKGIVEEMVIERALRRTPIPGVRR